MTLQTTEFLPTNLDEATPSPKINPWLFVPALYFMQMVPNQIVTGVFVTAYKKLEVPNAQIALWTSLAALPWTLKLFWSPLIDLNFTKRRWITLLQAAIAVGLMVVAWAVQTAWFWPTTLAALFLLAICSATHDIAADGFYILSLKDMQRARFVGVLTTSARLGKMFCLFFVVYIAGSMEGRLGIPKSWTVALSAAALLYVMGTIYNFIMLPRPVTDVPAANVPLGENRRNIGRTLMVVLVGLCLYAILSGGIPLLGDAIFRLTGRTKTLAVWEQSPENIRRLSIWLIAGTLGIFPASIGTRIIMRGTVMAEAFVSYVRQPGIVAILCFILLYRLGEAMVGTMSRLFVLDAHSAGGLGLSTIQQAHIDGITGVIGIIMGGLAGGYFVSRLGMRRSFLPLAICMHLPNLLYVWAAWKLTPPLWTVYLIAFVDQFGYGFGFAGYMLYLMYVATRGQFKTTHYAISTGLGALGITLAGILSGIIQSTFGYLGFFVAVCFLTIPGMLTLLFIPMDNSICKE